MVSDDDAVVTYSDFSEPIIDMVEGDITVDGGTLDAGSVSVADDNMSATFSVTATQESVDNLRVTIHDTVLDVHGNRLRHRVDTENPVIVDISSSFTNVERDDVVSDSDDVVTYTVSFSEAINTMAEADITVSGGTLDAGSVVVADDSMSATFSVTATQDSMDSLTVTVHNTVVDVHGNILIEDTSSPETVDTVNPEITSISSSFANIEGDGVVSDSDAVVSYTVTSQRLLIGMGETDITVNGGTLDAGSISIAGDSVCYVLSDSHAGQHV